MNFYDFMSILDKFCIEKKDLDFREIEVHCNRILNTEVFFISDKDKISNMHLVVVLDDKNNGK